MFISTEYLVINYGIDEKIARFFVDREPPADNLYWHEKLLYLRPGVGYIFIPLIVDLLYKMGISRDALLSDPYISTMEQTGHISALEETKQIDSATAIQQCADLVKDTCKDTVWFNDIIAYFGAENNYINKIASPFKALHRGDMFLFSICALELKEAMKEKIVEQWFALITTLLLLDDADDAKEDMKTGEENAFLEKGLTMDSIELATQLVAKNLETIGTLNKTMAGALDRQYKVMIQKPLALLNTK